MKILAISDIHDRFEVFPVDWNLSPSLNADLCVIAGDLTDWGRPAEIGRARGWLKRLAEHLPVLWIPGNHDIGMGAHSFLDLNVRCILNQTWTAPDERDQPVTFHGVSCSPCYDMPTLARTWAYMTADEEEERRAYDFEAVDVVVSHSPPWGILDTAGYVLGQGERHIGSEDLLRYMGRHKPRLVICGHVHEATGRSVAGNTVIYNVAGQAIVIDLDRP